MLKVDHREVKIKAILASSLQEEGDEKKSVREPVFENLTYGDFQILDKEGKIVFLFERKTLDDLASSIKDGRYKNQKAKCTASFSTSQIYYIIEGNLRFRSNTKSQSEKMLVGAVLNTSLRDKIAVFQTRNVEETWELIQCVYQRYLADPSKYVSVSTSTSLEDQDEKHAVTSGPTSAATSGAINGVTIVQSDMNSTPRTVYKCMLCQIPAVSDKTALAIMDVYPTLSNLMSVMMPLSTEERKALLEKIKVNGRKISCRVVDQMLLALFSGQV